MLRKSKKCKNCGKNISMSNYTRHINSIKCQSPISNLTIKQLEQDNKIVLIDKKYKCLICDKIYTLNGIGTHFWRTHTINGQVNYHKGGAGWNIGIPAWNKGLTKETNSALAKASQTLKQKCKENYGYTQPKTEEAKKARTEKQIATMKRNGKCGGYRENSGRGKKQWYDSLIAGKVFLQSSYEVAYAKWLDENNILWKRNLIKFPYNWESSIHYYYPDFYLIESDEYVEIKGYKTDKDLAKWNDFPYKLTVLFGEDLKNLGLL